MSEVTLDPAVTVCFKVKIDDHDLGTFTGCDGMGLEVTMEQREEGGNNGYVHQLPGRIKYTPIKLTRAVNADTQKIATWFSSLAGGVTRGNAAITAMTVEGKEIWTWTLREVVPLRWKGPTLDVGTAKVATETLELAHHGFLA